MELFLNILWLAISIAGFVWFARQERLGSTFQRRVLLLSGVFALTCVAALLFPIISVTDDLHSDATCAEEWSRGSRGRGVRAASQPGTTHGVADAPASLVSSVPAPDILLTFLYRVSPEPQSRQLVLIADRAAPRSPPSLA
ncbi:MAG TPA: hypothetical protein VEZ11_02635 [Thermoanaerobaculia bacterium]|nr:hypothetical protein [Thermoanaerobaculia bacterium]